VKNNIYLFVTFVRSQFFNNNNNNNKVLVAFTDEGLEHIMPLHIRSANDQGARGSVVG
jgi:hypothetical protein